ncbi:MAG: MFS transporter [Acidobacteriaceae bacterium]|nr:MFS transporter [Acidobacteriaceae bacterium]
MATSSTSLPGKSPSPETGEWFSRTFKAFHYRDFRVMWVGACTSSIGSEMQRLAQSWLVLQLSGSAFMLGLDAFLGEIPIFLFSLIGGVVADRVERRNLLLMSQFIQMTCAFVLTVLFGTHTIQVWHILTLSFVSGLARSFGAPAYAALVPTLVDREHLPNAIALNSIQFNLARVIGPAIGGFALANWGAVWCFGLNGISFIAVIISLFIVRSRFIPTKTGESMLQSMKQGISFVQKQQAMGSLIVLAFCMTGLAIPLLVFLPVFAKNVLHGDARTFTILLGSSGVGSVVGALVVAALGRVRRQGALALAAIVALGSLILLFSFSRSLAASAFLVFLAGGALIAVFAMVSSLVQTITPDNMRGRVMSVYNVAFRGGMPIGSLVMGSLVKQFTVPVVLACNGVLLAVLGLYLLTIDRKVAEL